MQRPSRQVVSFRHCDSSDELYSDLHDKLLMLNRPVFCFKIVLGLRVLWCLDCLFIASYDRWCFVKLVIERMILSLLRLQESSWKSVTSTNSILIYTLMWFTNSILIHKCDSQILYSYTQVWFINGYAKIMVQRYSNCFIFLVANRSKRLEFQANRHFVLMILWDKSGFATWRSQLFVRGGV